MDIVWTISRAPEQHSMVFRTKQKVDNEDEVIYRPNLMVWNTMTELSEKYGNRGFAVLFDVE